MNRMSEKYSAPKNAHNLILQENQDEDDYDYYTQFDSGLHMARNLEVAQLNSNSKELYKSTKKNCTNGNCQKMQQTIGYAPSNNLKTPKSFSTLNYDGVL
jgi:hypothetical protein